MKTIRVAAIGCGNRTAIYISLLMKHYRERFEITALADPIKDRRESIAAYQTGEGLHQFDSATSFLNEAKMADVVIIGTQDNLHFEPAMKALEKGYDLVLEKPISDKMNEVLMLNQKAKELNRKILVCHVLRYSPFYNKVKELIDLGKIGDIISVNAEEGVNPWHQTHSFVRGKWAKTKDSSPMILAKSCHDMDLLSWLTGEKCQKISSFGSLTFFRSENAPEGAPSRCTDGCPASANCPYNALLYLDKRRVPWLAQLVDDGMTDRELVDWLRISPWGRCVYRCDNDAVDHQVVSMRFDSDITATFTMTAFDTGRNIAIYGTKGVLKGGEFVKATTGHEIIVVDHETQELESWDLENGVEEYDYHNGGDFGFVSTWYTQFSAEYCGDLTSSITKSVESHSMAWAAEESRITGKTVVLAEYLDKVSRSI